jgi:hypothetical protein
MCEIYMVRVRDGQGGLSSPSVRETNAQELHKRQAKFFKNDICCDQICLEAGVAPCVTPDRREGLIFLSMDETDG